MNLKVSEMNPINAAILHKERHNKFWYYLLRTIIGLLYIIYLASIIDSTIKLSVTHSCTDYVNNLGANIIIFLFIRLIKHFSLITYNLFVFWPMKTTKNNLGDEMVLISPSLEL